MSAIKPPQITVFDSKPTDAYFFGTCVLDLFMPEAGMDAITLIEQQGIRIHYPMEHLPNRMLVVPHQNHK